jgi:hypothetical protein
MHFDQRTQAALREIGLSDEQIGEADDLVKARTASDAETLAAFFEDHATVYSDMDRAHGAGGPQEHAVEHVHLYTHAADIRGYLQFDTWGVPIEGGRPLPDGTVELTLGPTVDGRVRFSTDPEAL